MIRFVDKSAIDFIREVVEGCERLGMSEPSTCFAFIDGFAVDKDLGLLREFVNDELELDMCCHCGIPDFFGASLSKVGTENPIHLFRDLLARFVDSRPWCPACGQPILLDDDFTNPYSEWLNCSDGRIYHTNCCRSATYAAEAWTACANCNTLLERSCLRTALQSLKTNVFSRGRSEYSHIQWRFLLIDEQEEFDGIMNTIPKELSIVERKKQFTALLPKLDRDLSDGLSSYESKDLRRFFEPVHVTCTKYADAIG